MLQAPSRLANVRNDEMPMIAAGVQEIGLSGSFDWTDDTVYNTNLSYGWFLNDCWLFGFKVGVSGVNSDANVTAGLFTEYNIHTGTKWVPFVGGGVNYKRLDTGDDSADGIETGLEFGVKYFLRANMAISASMTGA
ncbi:MAG: hypothetical protein Q7R22_013130 [Verrucomicrobiota bacterium JB025]|nr:hypothetical protein [Verrucomicrobiota bacterium JB025]